MVRKIKLKVKKLNKKATLPSYAHEGDVGMDIKPIDVHYDVENDAYVYDTGLACETDIFASAYCFPKSRNYKTNYYLTNHVGIVDTKTYRGEIKVIFKNRDSIDMRILAQSLVAYDELPWYKKLRPGIINDIRAQLTNDFLKNPLQYAPYKVGDATFQLVLQEMVPVEVIEVKKLSDTKRGSGGFGSTEKKGN